MRALSDILRLRALHSHTNATGRFRIRKEGFERVQLKTKRPHNVSAHCYGLLASQQQRDFGSMQDCLHLSDGVQLSFSSEERDFGSEMKTLGEAFAQDDCTCIRSELEQALDDLFLQGNLLPTDPSASASATPPSVAADPPPPPDGQPKSSRRSNAWAFNRYWQAHRRSILAGSASLAPKDLHDRSLTRARACWQIMTAQEKQVRLTVNLLECLMKCSSSSSIYWHSNLVIMSLSRPSQIAMVN